MSLMPKDRPRTWIEKENVSFFNWNMYVLSNHFTIMAFVVNKGTEVW
jgi:hypothetical protein